MDTTVNNKLVVDVASREVWVRGRQAKPALSRKEFDILEALYRNHGTALSRDDIAGVGWPERVFGDVNDEEIHQYISRIRRHIEINPSCPKLIVTLRGFGYRMS